jgi:hypothetical protein
MYISLHCQKDTNTKKLNKMKTIITISALMLTFGLAKANNLPANETQSATNSEKTSSMFMLDSLQISSESTPFNGFDYLNERIQQKLIEMQSATCMQGK